MGEKPGLTWLCMTTKNPCLLEIPSKRLACKWERSTKLHADAPSTDERFARSYPYLVLKGIEEKKCFPSTHRRISQVQQSCVTSSIARHRVPLLASEHT